MKTYEKHITGTAINENSSCIKIEGHIGRWYVVDSHFYQGKKVFLLEHESYGDDVACLIVDKDLNIIMDDVWNGFSDLDDL